MQLRKGENCTIVDEKVMNTWLDEQRMEIVAKYNGETYVVGGNTCFAYIVVG